MSWKKQNLDKVKKITLSAKAYSEEEKRKAKYNLELLHQIAEEVPVHDTVWQRPNRMSYTTYNTNNSKNCEISLYSPLPLIDVNKLKDSINEFASSDTFTEYSNEFHYSYI